MVEAVIALLGVIIGSYLTYRWSLTSQIRISNHQQKLQVFSKLMGIKFLITQTYVSRFEALIYSDHYEALSKLNGQDDKSFDFLEAQRWMYKSENLVSEIAKNNQSLFEIIGLIRILFPPTKELDELINRIYNFKAPAIKKRPFDLPVGELNNWVTTAIAQLQDLVEVEYAKPIDNLLSYLAVLIKEKK